MSETARALGMGADFTYQGKTYTMAPWTLEIQGRFERWLVKNAWDEFFRYRPFLPADEVGKARDSLVRSINAGDFKFGGEIAEKATDSVDGLTQLVFLMFQANHHEITLATVEAMMKESAEQVMAAMDTAIADPTPPAPETPVPGPMP